MSLGGAEVHIEVMNKFRLVYRNLIVETILLFLVLVQIISGIKLFFSKRQLSKSIYEILQIWSGLYMAFFLIIHVSAVLGGRYILKLDTNFHFGVAGLNTFPLNLFFIPYYGLAILSFFGHVASIHYQKMEYEFLGLPVKHQSQLILIIGIVVAMIILYGSTNGFTGVEIPEEYNVLIGK